MAGGNHSLAAEERAASRSQSEGERGCWSAMEPARPGGLNTGTGEGPPGGWCVKTSGKLLFGV